MIIKLIKNSVGIVACIFALSGESTYACVGSLRCQDEACPKRNQTPQQSKKRKQLSLSEPEKTAKKKPIQSQGLRQFIAEEGPLDIQLFSATARNDKELMGVLIEAKADVNRQLTNEESKTLLSRGLGSCEEGSTPLHFARTAEAIKVLLDNGAHYVQNKKQFSPIYTFTRYYLSMLEDISLNSMFGDKYVDPNSIGIRRGLPDTLYLFLKQDVDINYEGLKQIGSFLSKHSEFRSLLNNVHLALIEETKQSRLHIFDVLPVAPLASLVTDYVYGGLTMEWHTSANSLK